MATTPILRRLHRLSGRELADFVEAACALTFAAAAIRLLPFRTVVRMMNVRRRPSGTAEAAGEVRLAIRRASRRLPWKIVCFPEGLAAHWMLRRRGAPSLVHYGVRQSNEGLTAHVWVSLGDEVVVGEETTDAHTCVAVFPSPPASQPRNQTPR
jgi:hypothetical protein